MASNPQDAEHLKLLTIFHYVAAGLIGICSLFPVIHLVLGVVMIVSPETMTGEHGERAPAFLGWLFAGVATLVIIGGLALAVAVLMAANALKTRRRYTFCFVVAVLECLFMPLGTVLGVFTIIVLMRESVKQLFGRLSAPPPLAART